MGTVHVGERMLNITEALKNQGHAEYTSAQGFTIAPNGVSYAMSLDKHEDYESSVLMSIIDWHVYTRFGMDLGHCNDCEYYNGCVYVTVGGDGANRKKVNRLAFSTYDGWKYLDTFTYVPKDDNGGLDRVSGIAHISGDNFILSEGKKFSVCWLDEEKKQLAEFSRFQINDVDNDQLSRNNCYRRAQGIYYAKNKLYKVFVYENNTSEKIKRNDIAVFNLQGNSPSFTGMSMAAKYACDDTSKVTFELEGIGSADSGNNMYMLANVRNTKESGQSDSIYKITLKN